MAKLSDLTLEELYQKEKITPAVLREIVAKEDFSKISHSYCEKVCKLKCKTPSQAVIQRSSTTTDIVIIQDHFAPDGKFDKFPGAQEKKHKQIMEFIAKEAGLRGLDVRILTLLKCKPNNTDFPRGKSPTTTVLSKCSPYLIHELNTLKPKAIISTSTAVTKALGLKKHSNSGNRGEIVQSEFGPVVITLSSRVLTMIRQNASGAMWGPDYFNKVRDDYAKAGRIARGQLVIPDMKEAIEFYKRERIFVTKSIEEVKHYLNVINSLHPNALISFDTETTGLDGMAPDARLLTIQFGWRDTDGHVKSVVIPLWHRENRAYDPDEAWRLIVPLLIGPRGKVAHNAKYDVLYIYYTTGIRVKNIKFDTMLVLHSIASGNQKCYGLKTATFDVIPDMGFAGYENLLPKLTKPKKEKPVEVAVVEEDTEEEVEEVVEVTPYDPDSLPVAPVREAHEMLIDLMNEED